MAERVALIIPARNEEQSLPGVLAEIADTALLGAFPELQPQQTNTEYTETTE
jgi:hypothetical protein